MLFFTGIISGIISGLGMGGGTILIIVLTNVFKVDQHIAQGTNLLFFIPTSIIALLVHIKNKNINVKIVLKMLPVCIIGAICGAFLSSIIVAERLRKYFGIFLICIGGYEFLINVKNKLKENQKEDIKNEKFDDRDAYRSNNRWNGRNRCKR